MSRENIEIVRRAYEAFDRLDTETIAGLLGDDFKVVALLHDTASLGDAVVERDLAHLWTMRGGKAVRLQAFTTHAAALDAAGLPE